MILNCIKYYWLKNEKINVGIKGELGKEYWMSRFLLSRILIVNNSELKTTVDRVRIVIQEEPRWTLAENYYFTANPQL
jgi:hypothetical protein